MAIIETIDVVTATVDWTGVRHVIDDPGSDGTLLAAILRDLPEATGVLFDEEAVVAGAHAVLGAAGVEDRVDVEAGSFFAAVPPGGDLYLLANVLWSWSDQEAVQILRRCRDAMAASARLVICEPEGTRSTVSWRVLLGETGFEVASITPVPPNHLVIEGWRTPPDQRFSRGT